jgi:hypothetical protein
LIQVYHDGEKWCAGTSGTAFAEGEIQIKGIMKITYFELFSEAIGNDIQKTFKNYNKNFTFLFELVSPENRIVTRYSKTEAFLLAIRNKLTGHYINCDDYPEFTQPEKFNLNNPDDIVSMVESLSNFKEGVVCYDPTTGNRIKMKSPAYVAVHHLRGGEFNYKSALTLILENETDEYLTYFPEDAYLFAPWIEKINKLERTVKAVWENTKTIEDQKEFALQVKDFPYSGFLFQMRKKQTYNDILKKLPMDSLIRLLESL